MENCKELNNCLCCDSQNLRTILDLGNQSPANNYNVKDKFPLRLNVCLECSHAQLSHSVNPDILFRDYPYMSGVSKTMLEYYQRFARNINNYAFVRKEVKNVFEIACNDGAQLDALKEFGFETYGIDPAENLHKDTLLKGHVVTCGYFPQDAPDRTFDLIIAQNVIAHNSNPYEFLMGCKKIMNEDSILVIQTSQARMIENHQFDTIYHEHISFFNKRSFSKLFNRCDLDVVEHEFIEGIHGGSDVYYLKKMPEISILDYSDFQNRCYKFAYEFRHKVDELKKSNTIICYGAAAKMINLIRFTGIKPDYIMDDTPTKIGNFIEGIYVNRGEALKELAGGYIIPVWNFADEIKNKVESQYPGKFKFLKYIPIIE
jgi:SAM-dependent methyltransferase